MFIENEIKLDFKDVLIRPKRSTLTSRSQVNLIRNIKFKHNPDYEWSGIPIMVSNMDTTGTYEMAKSLVKQKIFTCIHKHYTLEDWRDFHIETTSFSVDSNYIYDYISVTSGISINDLDKLDQIMAEVPIKFISLDVANGYTDNFANIIESTRKKYPDKVIIAGTVVTREMTEELLIRGADVIRVGIGSGSVCTTRIKTGVGYPQISAIIECADAAKGLGGHIVSDGGCTCPGDYSKAFGAGADFVMSGGMFSGHTESAGDLVEKNGKQFKEFYGMSSSIAMNKYSGGVAKYRASEGKSVLVPYKGDVENTVSDLLGGIRSTCTYVGATCLNELNKRTTFIRVTQQANEIYGRSNI